MAAIDIQKERIKNGDIDSFFDCLADILLKFSGGTLHQTCQNFNKYFSPYMICRYISMKPQLIEFAEVLNQLQTVLSFEESAKCSFSPSNHLFLYSIYLPMIKHCAPAMPSNPDVPAHSLERSPALPLGFFHSKRDHTNTLQTRNCFPYPLLSE